MEYLKKTIEIKNKNVEELLEEVKADQRIISAIN
jgi:hypothetical protein